MTGYYSTGVDRSHWDTTLDRSHWMTTETIPQDATPVDPDHDDGDIYEDPEAKTDVPGQHEPEDE